MITPPNEDLLDEVRASPICEWCKGKIAGAADPHHLWAKGMGGGSRLDVRINLIALCRFCHGEVHAGHIPRCDLAAIVAKREGTTPRHIELVIYWLKRLPKEATDADVAKRLRHMPDGSAALAARVWGEICQSRSTAQPDSAPSTASTSSRSRRPGDRSVTF